MRFDHWKIVPVLGAFALAACGGDGDGNSGPTATADPVAITTDNADDIAGSVLDIALNPTFFDSLFESASPVASSGGASAPISSKTQRVMGQAIMQAPIGPETTECLDGGSVTISGNVADPLTLTEGDSFTLSFNNCAEEGETLNGSLTMTIASFQGDIESGQMLLGINLVLSDYEVETAEGTETGEGDMAIVFDTTQPPVSTVTSSGDSVSFTEAGSSETLTNFNFRVTADESVFPVAGTWQVSGTVENDDIGGAATFSTPVPFQVSGEANPSAGELLIEGANGDTVRIIAMDAENVRLEIVVAQATITIDTTWDALDDENQ